MDDAPMTGAEFQQCVIEALKPLTDDLTEVLRRLVSHEYPEEVELVDFVVEPQGFTEGFPVRAFFFDDGLCEVFVHEDGEATYPSPVDPGLLEVGQIYDPSIEEAVHRYDASVDYLTLAAKTLIPWFEECWLSAGGADFSREATIRLHDDREFYDLIARQWRRE